MKKITVLVLGLLAVMMAAAQSFNDPNAEVRDAKGFHGINVSHAFDVYLSQGDEAVAVSSTDMDYRSRIKVEVKDGILFISLDNQGMKWAKGNKHLKAYVSYKKLDKINISGACDVYINGSLKADELKVDLSGASDLKGKLDVKTLDVDISGASDMTVTGTANQLKIDASGASNFKGQDLSVDYCNVDASGASDVKITVNKELSANVSGASDLRYKGEGLIRDIRTSGAGSVKRI
jgi:Putative auto-transporter adhesin, head GIN domain